MRPIGPMGPICLFLALAPACLAGAEVAWDTIARLTNDPSGQYTGYSGQHAVAVDAGGNVHVAWLDQRDVPYQVWYRRYDASAGMWLAETALSSRPANCFRPGIACDSAGNVHVVWHLENWQGPGIWYKRYDAAANRWRLDTLIDTTTTSLPQQYPSVACVPGIGDVTVAWYGLPDTGAYYRVFLKERHAVTGWDSAVQVSTAAVNHDQVSVVAGSNGDVAVVWCGMDLGSMYNQVLCRRRVAGSWQDVELVSDMPDALTQYSPGVAFDRAGAVHVVWHGRSGMNFYQQVYHRERDSVGWSGIDSISGERPYQQQFPSIACDAKGRAHAVWASQAGTDHMQLVYSQRDTDGVWGSRTILTALDSGDVSYPSIACDADSGIHIVWYDASSGNQDVYYLRGFTPGPGVTEAPNAELRAANVGPTIVRNLLVVPQLLFANRRSPIALLDALGRRVASLAPGMNTVRGLPAGVYFAVPSRGAVRPARVMIVR